ncbi:MAG: hypothetical protein ACRDFT_00935 [bacterium]
MDEALGLPPEVRSSPGVAEQAIAMALQMSYRRAAAVVKAEQPAPSGPSHGTIQRWVRAVGDARVVFEAARVDEVFEEGVVPPPSGASPPVLFAEADELRVALQRPTRPRQPGQRLPHRRPRKGEVRHQILDGDLSKIIELAITELIKNLEKKKLGATMRPRDGRQARPDSRHIPAKVRQQVWARDGGQCAFVADDGRRCTEKALLEFHHVEPYMAGGRPTVENIELRCRAHNTYEAELYVGPVQRESDFKTVRKLGL